MPDAVQVNLEFGSEVNCYERRTLAMAERIVLAMTTFLESMLSFSGLVVILVVSRERYVSLPFCSFSFFKTEGSYGRTIHGRQLVFVLRFRWGHLAVWDGVELLGEHLQVLLIRLRGSLRGW